MAVPASSPVPFTVKFDKADISDLRSRLKATRWPTDVEGVGWQFGAPIPWIQSLAASWAGDFDFSAEEARFNQFPNFTARIGATLPASRKKSRRKAKKGADDAAEVADAAPPPPRALAPLDVHFIHKKANSDRPAAPPPLPLLLLHGWPGSVVEFLAVIGPLTDPGPENPTAQAFDVVVPSLPGFGFSEAPKEAGWGLKAMASCFDNLMTKVLKYESYCVQGGDWGSIIARRMALDFGSVPAPPSVLDKVKGFFAAEKLGASKKQERLMTATAGSSAAAASASAASSAAVESASSTGGGGGVVAIHQNMAIAAPRLSSPRTFLQLLNAPFAHVAPVFITKDEAKGLRGLLIYQTKESGYFKIQSTKPMTLGYGLSDSPVAALAWVSEKFHAWGDLGADRSKNPDDPSVPGRFSRDDILLNACLYWFGNRACSSVRIYKEVEAAGEIKKLLDGYVRVPTAVLDMPRELFRPPRAWIAAGSNLKHFTRASSGGHFAALERPEVFVRDVRDFFSNWGRYSGGVEARR